MVSYCDVLESRYGVCAHPQRWEYDCAETEFEQMADIGIRNLRFDFDWSIIEPSEGVWKFEKFDYLTGLCRKNGITPLPILGYNVSWANPAHRNLDRWLSYVEQVMTRYGKCLPAVEIWNEENVGGFWQPPNAKEYTEFLAATYRKIKLISPETRVVFGGLNEIPLSYIREALRAGAGKAMDVMAVHPYHLGQFPESYLPYDLATLRRELDACGAKGIPIYMTETGCTTPRLSNTVSLVLPALFRELKQIPSETTAYIFRDSKLHYYTESHNFHLKDVIPDLKKIIEIQLDDLDNLPIDDCSFVVLPLNETFPDAYHRALLNYVRRGGRVLSLGGFPFYYNRMKRKDGLLETTQIGDRDVKDFHIHWIAPWTREGTPHGVDSCRWADGFEQETVFPAGAFYRYFTAENLSGNDRLVPILYADKGDFHGIIAGVYHFDSELKGKFAFCACGSADAPSEEQQAQLLPRIMLLAFASRVKQVFWYSFRSTEWEAGNPGEAHFGIIRRNLTPKPAYHAYKTLIAAYPDGSETPRLTISPDDSYFVRWKRTDGRYVLAAWTPSGTRSATLNGGGKPIECLDYMGQPCDKGACDDQGNLTVELTPSICYFFCENQL